MRPPQMNDKIKLFVPPSPMVRAGTKPWGINPGENLMPSTTATRRWLDFDKSRLITRLRQVKPTLQ